MARLLGVVLLVVAAVVALAVVLVVRATRPREHRPPADGGTRPGQPLP